MKSSWYWILVWRQILLHQACTTCACQVVFLHVTWTVYCHLHHIQVMWKNTNREARVVWQMALPSHLAVAPRGYPSRLTDYISTLEIFVLIGTLLHCISDVHFRWQTSGNIIASRLLYRSSLENGYLGSLDCCLGVHGCQRLSTIFTVVPGSTTHWSPLTSTD